MAVLGQNGKADGRDAVYDGTETQETRGHDHGGGPETDRNATGIIHVLRLSRVYFSL